ncbi:MAG: phosphate transport system permease protein [Solirubrobacteraceae bacterium]|nr:phosphate transport system permease protein [Solirubrobacteraceae bacterium]
MAALPSSARRTRAVELASTWRRVDRGALALCWAAGIALCVIAAAIVLYMLYKGIQTLRPALLVERPADGSSQAVAGGFFDPLIGTLLLTTMGTAIALPLGVASALWIVEYGRPTALARAVETGIEMVAGTPTIVLAIFGLALFSQGFFGPLSFTAEGGAVFGRSFLIAAMMMSFIALPLIFGSTREALMAVPNHVREASYALGKTKWSTIRKVLLPSARPGIATGTVLGMGRIAGDTAIVVILLGATLRLDAVGGVPLLTTLRGTGSTLTSYVYNNSPAGEGNAYDKAYAAAFVLLLVVIGLNLAVDLIGRGRRRGGR